MIGPKNRGCITRTMTYKKTPIYVLFLGLMRSALFQSGAHSTATLQPFFSLQLEIQVSVWPLLLLRVHELVSRSGA